MRLGENFVYAPSRFEPLKQSDVDQLSNGFTCTPNSVGVKMLPIQEKIGSIYLPSSEGTQEKYRSEIGVVIDPGPSALRPGDVVMVRPYKGIWVDTLPVTKPKISNTRYRAPKGRYLVLPDDAVTTCGILRLADIAINEVQTGWVQGLDEPKRILYSKHFADKVEDGLLSVAMDGVYCEIHAASLISDFRFYGVTYDWEHEILAVWRDGSWMPLNDWHLVRRKDNSVTTSGIYIPNPDNKRKSFEGYDIHMDEWFLCDDNTNTGVRLHVDGQATGLEFIKEVDEDGTRQIFAVLGSA